jgi:antitoxin FitA
MVGNLHVRNLDDDLIARLKRRAARHGRSTEAEHRKILRQALMAEVEPSFETLAAELRKLTRRRKQTPAEDLLREGAMRGEQVCHRWQHRHQMGGRRGGDARSADASSEGRPDRARLAGPRVREHTLEKGAKARASG